VKIVSAEFVKSAFSPKDYPPEALPEVAFAGKSNVGKSSLINTLVNRKKLARTSSTPGRTQSLNFYLINERLTFVDLPGYGFAHVSKDIRRSWKPMVESYLKTRKILRLVVVILDSRRMPSDDDQNLLAWLREHALPALVVLTKIDKLSRNQRAVQIRDLTKTLMLEDDQMVVFSAISGEGKDDVWHKILASCTSSA
jgi:GTP-binding protein